MSVAFVLASCSSSEELEWSTSSVTISAVGPLFEGSNTGTFEWSYDLVEEIDGLDNLEDILNARLVSIELTPDDVDVLEDVTIQLAGEKTGMQKIAFMNADGNVQVAEKQENLASFFLDNYPTLVADFNLLDDWYDDYNIEAKLVFLFNVKTN